MRVQVRDQSPWSSYEPGPADPWDLRKVAHLHRRAGFGATRAELLRDLPGRSRRAASRTSSTPLSSPPKRRRPSTACARPRAPRRTSSCSRSAGSTASSTGPTRSAKSSPSSGTATSPPATRRSSRSHSWTARTRRCDHTPSAASRRSSKPSSPIPRCSSGSTAEPARRKSPTRTSPASSSSSSPWARDTTPSATSARPPGRSPAGSARIARRFPGDRQPSSTTPHRSTTEPRPSSARPAPGNRPTSSGSCSIAPKPRHSWLTSSTGSSSARPARPSAELIEPLAAEIRSHRIRHRPGRRDHPPLAAFLFARGLSPADQVAGGAQRGAGADARNPAAGIKPTGSLRGMRCTGTGTVRPPQRRGLGRRPELDQQRHTPRANQLGRRRHLGPRRERPLAVRSRRMGGATQDQTRPTCRRR